nr:alpha/beta hydrolase [Noviherbaspirillum aridicola]
MTDAFANRTKVNAQEETRPQDARTFTPVAATAYPDYEQASDGGAGFKALTGTSAETDRWAGILGESAYRIEVPKNWNGKLVMYAHGYAGTGPDLRVTTPAIRRHLIENGYAWAASSYSRNYYDVRAGVEDTNALANAFARIAKERGRNLGTPNRTYIIGHSMGGHIAGAAVENETKKTAINKTRYDGAVPMCGVMADTELFDYFAAYQIAAQTLAGYREHPTARFQEIAQDVKSRLFVRFSEVPNEQGKLLAQAVENLTGGDRPVFDIGFANTALQNVVWGTFGSDGTVNGILNRPTLDTRRFVYQFDSDPAQSPAEAEFNTIVQRLTGDPEANRLRADGLRWIPRVNGDFKVPVVTIHTLGDMYVPFSMQQIYRQRAEAQGNADLLVQRAIRAPSHCDFTVREQTDAFDAMINWAENGVKPAGDDVLTPSTVASPTYGCAFTRNTPTVDDSPVTVGTRQAIAPLIASCPSS